MTSTAPLCVTATVARVVLWLFVSLPSTAQTPNLYRVVTYNVENLFDTIDHPKTRDEQFTPTGEMQWTSRRYRKKVDLLAHTIADMSGWSDLALLGLCEIENDTVLSDLLRHHRLRRRPYSRTSTHGKDPRGINVALIWNHDLLTLIGRTEVPPEGEPHDQGHIHPDGISSGHSIVWEKKAHRGRHALWCTFKPKGSHTPIDVIVVHAPSRRGGSRSTTTLRHAVLGSVKRIVEHISSLRPTPYIIILGDFNDHCTSKPLTKTLGAETHIPDKPDGQTLYNLSAPLTRGRLGTHVFQGEPWIPDQIILSGNWFAHSDSLPHTTSSSATIYAPEELRDTRPKVHPQTPSPRRTYLGPYYLGGHSDHFPSFITIALPTCKASE